MIGNHESMWRDTVTTTRRCHRHVGHRRPEPDSNPWRVEGGGRAPEASIVARAAAAPVT
jgi:hypothetical protein